MGSSCQRQQTSFTTDFQDNHVSRYRVQSGDASTLIVTTVIRSFLRLLRSLLYGPPYI